MTASPQPSNNSDLDQALNRFRPVFAQPITDQAHMERLAALQARIKADGLAAIWLDASSSLTYFTGLRLGQSERIHGALIGADGPPTYLTPVFEAPKLQSMMRIHGPMLEWEEDEDPFTLVADHLRHLSGSDLGIDPATPFRFASALTRARGGKVIDAGPAIAALRQLKSPEEIAIIQTAMDASWRVQRAVYQGLRTGISTPEVGQFIDAAHRALGLKPLFHAVQFGEATAYPHGVPHPQVLAEGDMVLVDMGGTLQGYQSDITRSYVHGTPTPRQQQLWHIEHAAHAAAFAAARLGATCEAVDMAARDTIASAGFGPGYNVPGLPHRTGHGLGMDIHEEPWIVKGNRTTLQPGMCFSIEPMLCVYGECGVRLEDIAHMTQDGPRWFCPPSNDLSRPFG
ncbi:Xaa-Pro peptidase family protein [Paracoccus sp. Z330]|uniref:Xaa-Pro peptidase family protein n=1 Tax=Paracoccus onchidii TaxID=3017813 RepID=A0ABT4ZDJ9_9RHOB|nr:Xaa-Pro peptidase family protein [Paracoccus onchidii]MDB6177349.1 Xaa-Pro peptidase family protein [Paracoccus onchidii]